MIKRRHKVLLVGDGAVGHLHTRCCKRRRKLMNW